MAIQCDIDYTDCRGERIAWIYSEEKLKYLLGQLVELSDENQAATRCYDICVSVVSKSWKGWSAWPGLVDQFQSKFPDLPIWFGEKSKDVHFPFPMIVVFAQYCPVPGTAPFVKNIFHRFNRYTQTKGDLLRRVVTEWPLHKEKHSSEDDYMTMSQLSQIWLMQYKREYNLPYIKRTYVTAATKSYLDHNRWAENVSDSINKIIESKGCYTSVQAQYYGGDESAFFKNRGNGTTYSRRDAQYLITVDAFWNEEDDKGAHDFARNWQKINDQIAHGNDKDVGMFSNEDRRVLWGSFNKEGEEWDLNKQKDLYYEKEDGVRKKYQQIQKVRARVDPHGIYTPNAFAVKANASPGTTSATADGIMSANGTSDLEAPSAAEAPATAKELAA